MKEKYDCILQKVMNVMKDDDKIKCILEEFPLQNDTSLELYQSNRKKRIFKLLNFAGLKTLTLSKNL